ncbi:MAG: type II toxin-antitoxin system HicB family antitoxin [Fimbriimonadales bacterium]|nr:MAG: HicB family protein [Fimbriimonadales bacterium]
MRSKKTLLPSRRYTAVILKEDAWYIARCIELGVTTQGRTLDEARANLQEAVELYLESFGEELPDSTQEVLLYPLEVSMHA